MLIAVFTNFLQGLGILGLVTFALEASLNLFASRRSQSAIAALVFATGVICTMSIPFEFGPGVFFDLRNVFLILAPLFGGIPAGIATATAAGLFRWYTGGIGLTSGLVSIIAATLFGIAALRAPRLFDNTLRGAAILGLGACVCFASILTLPWSIAYDVIVSALAPYLAVNFVGVFAAAVILRRRTQAVAREATLTREVEIDPLTGLFNRRAFDRLGPMLFERASRYAQPCSMLMVHLEGIKTVNEHFGRNARDQVLHDAAQVIAAAVPQGHLTAKVGSQEFAIMLLAKDCDQAAIIAEQIRAAVAAHDFNTGKASARLMVSIGLHAPSGNDVFRTALDSVDAALDSAKKKGRNRVEMTEAA